MEPNKTVKSQQDSFPGVGYASAAFLIWGLSPIYWKVLRNIPAFEINASGDLVFSIYYYYTCIPEALE